ncbi:MAG: rod shape-determining protein MreC [Prevotellaceae bacterium]|jgi:rod shape-determining protein MreC|nr:rod shape-determining protein MreC [Prevotellaceae bacterium]
MESLFRFIVKYHLFLTFILLEGISVVLISRSSYFRHSETLAKVDAVKGSVKKVVDVWKDYFNLQSKNSELLGVNLSLLDENIYLRNQLNYSMHKYDSSSNRILKNFRCIPANVIENTLNRNDNRLILNAGKEDGIERDMGVISFDGVVGIVDRVTDNFCTVTSLLNTSRNVNGKLKTTGIYGPLVWDRKDIRYVEMIDIPQHIPVHKGDTVVTSGHSLTFPEGILIGTVESYQLDKGVSYKIRIKLNNNFQSLYNVYVISSGDKREFDSLKREIKSR